MLFEFEFGNIWHSSYNINVNVFCNQFKQRLIDCFIQKWKNDLESNQVLSMYRHPKTNFMFENFLNVSVPERLRVPLSR